MQGRADKGIILTTGSFTQEAIREANREGVPPIELVDGDKLVTLFEKVELGVTPKKIYEVDLSFFQPFMPG
jgi:restriction system protein